MVPHLLRSHSQKGSLIRVLFIGVVLVMPTFVALSAGGSLAPTAPPQEIRHVRVTNVRDNSFSVSWLTTFTTTGEVHYGTDPASLTSVQLDDRGPGTTDDTHHVTVSGLLPSTTYYFDVVSGPISDTNDGAHYSVTTGPTLGLPPSPDPSYGQVLRQDGTTPANGALVYITLKSAGDAQSAPMSTWVDSGYWWANLANARTLDLSAYFAYDPQGGDAVVVVAAGAFDGDAELTTDTGADSPAPAMTLNACLLRQDYNCNCQVDLGDLDDIAGRWNSSAGDTTYDPAYDYEGDGVGTIRAYDLMQVAVRLDDVCF